MDGATGDTAHLVSFPEYELLEARYLRHRFSLHTHDSFVLAVVEGGAELLHVDGAEVVAYPGDVVLLSPGEVHDGAAFGAAGFAYRAVYPARCLVGETFELPPAALRTRCFASNVVTDPAAADALRAAHHRLAGMGDPLAGESALVEALRLLWDRYGTLGPARGPAAAACATTARDLIESRLTERVSLLELARACQTTPLGLLRAFRAAHGMPPHRYQLQRRVEFARQRLRGPAHLELATLAAELGFADQSHFTRVFKSVVGVTPGAYRRAAAGA
jgi:AraC-like DNA-binding protein